MNATDSTKPAAGAGQYVLNLCASTTPLGLAQIEREELKRFTFFVTRRFEEGRERFRLHMGYFATLAEAQEWLPRVRDVYPSAWAGPGPAAKARQVLIPPPARPPARPPDPAPAPARVSRPAATGSASAAPTRASPPQVTPRARQAPAKPRAVEPVRRAPRSPTQIMTAFPARPAAPRPTAPHRSLPASNVREVLAALADGTGGDAAESGIRRRTGNGVGDAAESGIRRRTGIGIGDAAESGIRRRTGIGIGDAAESGIRRRTGNGVGDAQMFAVHLMWSPRPAPTDSLPALPIFRAHTLYAVQGRREGRIWFGLRLGFFTDARAAKQAAYPLRTEFPSVSVVSVTPAEHARAMGKPVRPPRADAWSADQSMDPRQVARARRLPRAVPADGSEESLDESLDDPGETLEPAEKPPSSFRRFFGLLTDRMRRA